MPKLSPWWFAPPFYAGISGLLFALVRRAFSAHGQSVSWEILLDPRQLYYAAPRLVLVAVLLALAAGVWRRSPLVVLLTLQAAFVVGFLDVLHFMGTIPTKIDFRIGYVMGTGVRLAWLMGVGAVVALVVNVRRPRASSMR